ncbi:hypothetical protein MKX01_012957 [Papaver californicum]|nr:hypothetical protein MKX01_012957 [Papaver californicum]
MAQVPEYPSKLFFYCEEEPENGGETPIVLSHVIYEKMKVRFPEFVEKLDKNGLIYTRILGAEDDPSSPIGRGWQAARLGMKLEWTEDGVKTVMGPIPAIKYENKGPQDLDGRSDPVKAVTFVDGTPLPSDVIHECLKLLEEECVASPWQKGDVILIDNLAVLHSRRPFNPPRRILASLCK